MLTIVLRTIVIGALALLCVNSTLAVVDVYEFDTDSLRQRYQQLTEELRCPKCQNQNLAGSDSIIAGDLRRELRRLLEEGKSDREIKRFMVERYGEFVLYKPRLQKATLVLWGLPFLLLVIGFLAIWFIVKRRKSYLVDQEMVGQEGRVVILSTEEQQRLGALLDTSSASSDINNQSVNHTDSEITK